MTESFVIFLRDRTFLQKQAGIYALRSIFDKRCYVGSSSQLYGRIKRHFHQLKDKKHFNVYLQNFVNKHGIESLEVEILEFCTIGQLSEREQHYLNWLKPSFNLAQISHAPSIEYRRQLLNIPRELSALRLVYRRRVKNLIRRHERGFSARSIARKMKISTPTLLAIFKHPDRISSRKTMLKIIQNTRTKRRVKWEPSPPGVWHHDTL